MCPRRKLLGIFFSKKMTSDKLWIYSYLFTNTWIFPMKVRVFFSEVMVLGKGHFCTKTISESFFQAWKISRNFPNISFPKGKIPPNTRLGESLKNVTPGQACAPLDTTFALNQSSGNCHNLVRIKKGTVGEGSREKKKGRLGDWKLLGL